MNASTSSAPVPFSFHSIPFLPIVLVIQPDPSDLYGEIRYVVSFGGSNPKPSECLDFNSLEEAERVCKMIQTVADERIPSPPMLNDDVEMPADMYRRMWVSKKAGRNEKLTYNFNHYGSPSAINIINKAAELAQQFEQNYVGAEHLLLAMLSTPSCMVHILKECHAAGLIPDDLNGILGGPNTPKIAELLASAGEQR